MKVVRIFIDCVECWRYNLFDEILKYNEVININKVLTICDWWDGPIEGLAYYGDKICIYQKIFDEAMDDYIDEYYLIPISTEEQNTIMEEWENWCMAVEKNEYDAYFHQQKTKLIDTILIRSTPEIKIRKKAIFNGEFKSGYIPIDVTVEWID